MDRSESFLITGASGQLARAFEKILAQRGVSFFSFSRETLDITDNGQVRDILQKLHPEVVVNCAAYNFVDKAETDDAAWRVNATGPRELAALCQELGIFLVHFSTDYVFDGAQSRGYREDDVPCPLNVYGRTKLEGEREVLKLLSQSLVFRVSWVVGEGKNNFLYKVFEWSQGNPSLHIAKDEVSSPTFTDDIVSAVLLAREKKLHGLYHFSSSGFCSRFEMAELFLQKMGRSNKVISVPASTFQSKARRPSFSGLDNSKIQDALGIQIPSWQETVSRFVSLYAGSFSREAV